MLRQPAYWCNYSKPRMLLHSFVSSKYFDLASAGIIGLNVIMMALEYYLMPWVRTLLGRYTRHYSCLTSYSGVVNEKCLKEEEKLQICVIINSQT